jgi:hypothetical protein
VDNMNMSFHFLRQYNLTELLCEQEQQKSGSSEFLLTYLLASRFHLS